jgi:hypothetical protein|tara:strand:- start:515 stop:805 length:291 start_codon:yes stop_codon:yes gene_type:complete
MEGTYVMSKLDYKDLLERCVATFFQAVGGTLGTNSIVDMGVSEWKLILASGGAAVLSLLKGYAASILGKDGSCSVITRVEPDESDLEEMYGEVQAY